MSYQYILRNDRSKRPNTRYIILVQITDLIEDFYIDPSSITHNNFFTVGTMEDYFMRYLKKDKLPYHYYIDNIGSDWYTFKGLCEFQPSYYLYDLVQAGMIEYQYLDSMVIVLADDYTRYPVNKRMVEQLASKTLSDLLRRYNLDFSRVKYIDDCLKPNWEENMKMSNLKYKFKKARYFDFQQIHTAINKFKKN